MITHTNYDAYLWTDCDGWCLDDSLFNVDKIAIELANAPLFNKVPENVKELENLLLENIWCFEPGKLPSFKANRPQDDFEVLSWDNEYVLTGTSLENLTVLRREEWDKLCHRENNWFK
jgi:hypothetical protein